MPRRFEEPFYEAFVYLVASGELLRTLPRKDMDFIEGTYLESEELRERFLFSWCATHGE